MNKQYFFDRHPIIWKGLCKVMDGIEFVMKVWVSISFIRLIRIIALSFGWSL